MKDAVTLDSLIESIMFDTLDEANAKLAPYFLIADWNPEGTGDLDIISTLGGSVIAVLKSCAGPVQGDLFETGTAGSVTSDTDESYGAVIASAMEDSEDAPETFDFLNPTKGISSSVVRLPTEPYESPFRETPATDDVALRNSLINPASQLPDLLRFYANGTASGATEVTEEAPAPKFEFVNSTSDERTVNNTMRSAYRVLNDDEKKAVDDIKVMGQIFVDYLEDLGPSRENSIAKTKMEEAVMWAVKGQTA